MQQNVLRTSSPIRLVDLPGGETSWYEIEIPGVDPDAARGPLVAIARGREDGPTTYVGAGMHGDELNSIEAVRRVANSLEAGTLAGTVFFVILQNQTAFESRARLSPADGKNLDHCFPGSASGTPSEQLAKVIFDDLVLQADYLVDLHCASRGGWNHLYSIVHADDPEVLDSSISLARSFGCDVILTVEAEPGRPLGDSIGSALDSNLFIRTALSGRPAALIEFGGSAVIEESQVGHGVAGILNLLRHTGNLAGPEKTNSTSVVSAANAVSANVAGFLQLEKLSGDHVSANETLAFVRTIDGAVHRIESPIGGIILRTAAEGTIAVGDRIATMAEVPRIAGSEEDLHVLSITELESYAT